MIKAVYNAETGEATAEVHGTSTIVRAELIALRQVITNDPHLFMMWIDILEDQLFDVMNADSDTDERKEEA